MPFEITVSAKRAGSKEGVYTVTPARGKTRLTDAEVEPLRLQAPSRSIRKGATNNSLNATSLNGRLR